MWWVLLRHTIFSILIICLLHYLVIYFKDTYTTKKTKDVVGFHVQKYKDILVEYQENERNVVAQPSTPSAVDTPDSPFLSEDQKQSMSADLEQFIQEQSAQY